MLDGESRIDSLGEGQQGSVILDQTPFYAEAGGQVGDTGRLVGADGTAIVADTFSPVSGLIIHKVTIEKGTLKVGDQVTASSTARNATRRGEITRRPLGSCCSS